jgi:guanylate kinase
VISAASGTGKSTLTKRLLRDLPLCVLSISYTTRKPRRGERQGREYFFVSPGVFKRMLRQGAFLEHARVHGELYGTSRAQVDRALNRGCDILLDIDVQGAMQIRRRWKDSRLIFILPPDFRTLSRRLRQRGTEDAAAVRLRLKNAWHEIRQAHRYQYWVVNDRLERSLADLRSIIQADRLRVERMSQGGRSRNLPVFSRKLRAIRRFRS